MLNFVNSTKLYQDFIPMVRFTPPIDFDNARIAAWQINSYKTKICELLEIITRKNQVHNNSVLCVMPNTWTEFLKLHFITLLN